MPAPDQIIQHPYLEDPYHSVVRLWCLRLLTAGRGFRVLHNGFGPRCTELAELCGIPDRHGWGRDEELDPADQLEFLRRNLASAELRDPRYPEPLATNSRMLADHLGLSDIEHHLVVFLVLLERTQELDEALAMSMQGLRGSVWASLAYALAADPQEVRRSLDGDGLLFRSGLMRESGRPVGGHRRLEVELLPNLGDCLLGQAMDAERLFLPYFHPAPAPGIRKQDIPHLLDDLQHMSAVLRKAVQQGRRGVNILLYGRPGTGKTEFARLLASRAGLAMKEIASTTRTGGPIAPGHRLGAWSLCQHLLGRTTGSLVLFDEIEDAFEPSPMPFLGRFRSSGFEAGKAWINQNLENNPVPCIWIANSLRAIDPAHLRRFSMVREIGVPPVPVRRAVVKRYLGALGVSEAWQRRVADHPEVTPAQVSRVAEVCELAARALPKARREPFLTDQLNRHLELQNGRPLPVQRPADALEWKLELLQADRPLKPLFEGLRRSGQGRILLYGPPGTGKTVLVARLAEKLQRPLMSKAASDILDPYLGMTERRIATMFREAEQEGAVLLLDEADSLLRTRERARVSWEVTHVNELLMRMEAYPGVFVCATNLLDVIDSAALRRFDTKIRLGYPEPAKRWRLLLLLLKAVGVEAPKGGPERQARKRIEAMTTLAPGDFATVARRHQRFGEVMTLEDILDQLQDELRLKGGEPCRAIGFV